MVSLQGAAVDHVVDSAWGTDNDVDALLELRDGVADGSTTDSGEALDVHVITEGDQDLVDLLGELTGRSEDEGLDLLEVDVDLLEDGDGAVLTNADALARRSSQASGEEVALTM